MKTAYELALEKLRRQDEERGARKDPPLTPEQKEEIARIRQVYKARLAEREILHRDDLRAARRGGDPEAVRAVEEGYLRERERLEEEREAKIRAVREGGAPPAG